MSITIRRRTALAATGAAAIATSAAACGGGSSSKGGSSKSASVKLPTYKPIEGLKPDLEGSAEGLHSVFLKAPSELITTTKKAPITSGQVSALTETFATPPPPMDKNPFWQNLNKALGGTLKLTVVADDYPSKFATTLASGDLPDLMWVPPNQGIPNVGPMLESQFTDLTTYLSGDAVLEYPNLAALKPASWKTAVVNGKIWGAPIPSTPFGQVYLGNPDVWKKVGGFTASSADEFLSKCKELLVPGKKWALEPALINALHMFGEWFGAPNGFRVNKDRTLTHRFQTDEYKEAIEFAQKVWKAGVFYPDVNLADASTMFANGTIGAQVAVGPRSASGFRTLNKNLLAEILIPFAAVKGRRPVYDMGYGTVGFTPFKKTTDEKKIRELLDVINFLSAPFGTKEYMATNWGTEGQEYTVKDGNYVLTPQGEQNVPGLQSALQIMASGESVIYNPIADDSKYIYEQEKKLLEIAMQSPVKGLYSDTNSSKGASLTSKMYDTIQDVIQGRKTMDDYDKAVKEWESKGGKKILEEFAAVLPKDVPVTPSSSM